jgi:hypothetical protein
MGQVMAEALEGRDAAIWEEWVGGSTQAEIAQRRGLDQSTVSDAVRRYAASIPEADKRAYREKCLARLEALYQAHADQALVKPRTAAVVRSIVMDQAKLLGIIQTQVKHEGQVNVDHAHVLDPGPTVEELLERWRAEGKLTVRGQLTRLDQGGG